MRIRFLLPALMLGAGLLLPLQIPAQAKTSYKVKKYKAKKFKGGKHYKNKVAKHKTIKH